MTVQADGGDSSGDEFMETPAHAIAQTIVDTVLIDRFKFQVERPVDSYALLDDPTVRAAHDRDEYMPYWADIWPASRMLGKAIARHVWPKPPDGSKLRAIELGCGLGVPGLTASACGLAVTFTDYDRAAVRFAAANARRNKLTDFHAVPLDWRRPPLGMRFPVVIGADLSYEERLIGPLVNLIKAILEPGGICLLTDQDRTPAPILREALVYRGLRYDQETMRAADPGGPRMQGSLYRIRHADET